MSDFEISDFEISFITNRFVILKRVDPKISNSIQGDEILYKKITDSKTLGFGLTANPKIPKSAISNLLLWL
jgi:hypothetical protein